MFASEGLRGRPLLISGPCAAEDAGQVWETAVALKALGAVDLFRAGVWKPRTRPDAFEGRGEVALPWLQRIQQELGLPVCIEVATARHVELALKAGIAVLWLGARTTVNPFAVQEIADALQGVDIPVMVKNPVNPDLDLWIGAMERLHRGGIRKMAAIHRGFSVYQTKPYRNEPQWELAIELRRRLPQLPLFTDPSHMAGRRAYVAELAQQALDLQTQGLMVEVHPEPQRALSDAAQQLKPEDFAELLGRLVVRKNKPTAAEQVHFMAQPRADIDALDAQLLSILAQRMATVRNLGVYKSTENLSILQMERWQAIRESCLARAEALELSEGFIEQLMRLVHNEAIRQQMALYGTIGQGAELAPSLRGQDAIR